MNKYLYAIIVLIIFFMDNKGVQGQCNTLNCNGTTVAPNNLSSALGDRTTATGNASFAIGDRTIAFGMASFSTGSRTIAQGHYSSAFGVQSHANGYNSFAAGMLSNAEAGNTFVLGDFLSATANSTLVFGSGVDVNNKLTNNVPFSLMVGFNSIYPTFTVIGSEFGNNKTGKVVIGNVTTPMAKLHIKSDLGEAPDIFLQPHDWIPDETANIYMGNKYNGISAINGTGLVLNSEKNYYFGKGKVGIGLGLGSEPTELLQVNGTTLTMGFKMPQQNIRVGWVLTTDQNGNGFWAPTENLWYLTETNDVFRPEGNVGIGTAKPLSKLEVIGQVSIGYNVAAVDVNNLIVEGNVGIGTSNPEVKLDVKGKIRATEFQLLNGQLDGYILRSDNDGNASWVDPSYLDDGDWLTLANNLYVEGNRLIGIGTSSPTEALEVVGNIKTSGNIYGGHNDWQALKLFAGTNEEDGSYMTMNSNSDQTASIKFYAKGESGRIEFHNNNAQIMSIRGDNNVYLGDPDNSSSLFVYGDITAHSLRATVNIPWYDHVFKPDYQLMSLNKLEEYIKTNQHLPDIPTQKEVNENGVDLAEMNALLLKKVEESTLYVIELKKENEEIRDLLNTK